MSVRRGCRRDVATQRVTIGNFYGLDGLESISQTTLKNEVCDYYFILIITTLTIY